MIKKHIILFSLLLLFAKLTTAQTSDSVTSYKNKIYSNNIKTLRVYVLGNELSYPAIELNGENKILFEFDLLSNDVKDYSYSIIHCNADWQESNIFLDEFTDGFNENTISDYRFSENTRIQFVNYRITLPNDDVNIKVSGNYVIRVFETGNKQKTIATACFSIYEPKVNVLAEVTRPIAVEYAKSGQEVRFTIQHNDLVINDPFSEIKVRVYQNNRPDRVLRNLKPVFVRNNELVYSFEGDNVFLGGNEFRIFSTTGLHLPGTNVNAIKFADSLYHVQLRNDERRSHKKYFWEEDTNGRFVIFSNNKTNQSLEADYTLNYFYLLCEKPFFDSKVYVTGEFCNWNILPENELVYNFDTKIYNGKILMKQGVYSYSYICKNNYTNTLDETIIEGSHYQTENNYLIFVYFKTIGENYDKLIGYQVINSKYH